MGRRRMPRKASGQDTAAPHQRLQSPGSGPEASSEGSEGEGSQYEIVDGGGYYIVWVRNEHHANCGWKNWGPRTWEHKCLNSVVDEGDYGREGWAGCTEKNYPMLGNTGSHGTSYGRANIEHAHLNTPKNRWNSHARAQAAVR